MRLPDIAVPFAWARERDGPGAIGARHRRRSSCHCTLFPVAIGAAAAGATSLSNPFLKGLTKSGCVLVVQVDLVGDAIKGEGDGLIGLGPDSSI